MRWLLLLIIALLPTYLVRFSIGGIPTTMIEVLLLALFLSWFIQRRASLRVTGYRLLIPPTLRAPLVLFIFASVVSVIIAPDRLAALGLWRAYILEPLLFFIVMMDVARDWKTGASSPSVLSGSNAAIFPTSSLKTPHQCSTLLRRFSCVCRKNFSHSSRTTLGENTLWRDVTIALSLPTIVIALVAILQWFDPVGFGVFPIPNPAWIPEAVRRATGVYPFPNAIGLFLAPIVPLFVYHIMISFRGIFTRRQLLSVTYWLLITTAAIAAIMMARSDGAIIALFIGLFCFGVMHAPTRRWTLGVVFFATLVLAFSPLRTSIAQKLTFQEASGTVRIEQWYGTIAMLRDRPVLGAGLAAYPEAFAPYNRQAHIEVFQYPHNILLNFWTEMGLLGVLAFGWILVVFFRITWRQLLTPHSSLQTIVIITVMIVLLIHGLVDVPYFKNDLALFFWIPFVLLYVLPRDAHATIEE
jgi:hypothetical protein